MWTECIQELAQRSTFDRNTQNCLERIAAQSNVPRKKPKFINFMKNCMRFNNDRAEKLWQIIEDGLEEFAKKSEAKQQTTQPNEPIATNGEATKKQKNTEEAEIEVSSKKSKAKQQTTQPTEPTATNGKSTKKRKNTEESEIEISSKKSKTENGTNEEPTDANETANGDKAFDWQKAILKVFNKKQEDNQLDVELLKSKVIKRLLKNIDDNDAQCSRYEKKFKKQLKKVDSLAVVGNKVQLKG